MSVNTSKTTEYISNWLRDYSEKSTTNGFVVGVSGGIDSAVTSVLASLTGKNVLVLEMPIHQSKSQVNRAKEHIKFLKENFDNVSSIEVNLTQTFEELRIALPKAERDEEMSLVNMRARLRMTTLYYFAGLYSYLVAGTGNKIEDFGIGFFTKYGDGGVDLSPIANLMKSEVYEIGKYLNVVDSILIAPPTDGLWDDERTDEDHIGASYDELEWAMKYNENKVKSELTLNERQKEVLKIFTNLNRVNQHKMIPIPICVIPDELRFK